MRRVKVGLALLVPVLAVAAVAGRSWANRSLDTLRPGATAAGGEEVRRVPVAIDERRRQLSGVRTVAAEWGTLTSHLQATGVVAYDETRLVDVNLKVEGWIRDL